MASIQQRVVRDILSLDESVSCAEAARCMADRGVGSIGVRRGGRVVGLVSERDLVGGVVAAAASADQTTLGAVMPALPVVPPHASDRECAQLMRSLRTRHLPVAERGEIVGLISMLDLVDLVVEEKQAEIESLEGYIRGGRAQSLSQPTTATVFGRPALAH